MNNYLEKLFYIIAKDSKQLIMLPNDVKLIINVIDQLDTYFFMAKNGGPGRTRESLPVREIVGELTVLYQIRIA